LAILSEYPPLRFTVLSAVGDPPADCTDHIPVPVGTVPVSNPATKAAVGLGLQKLAAEAKVLTLAVAPENALWADRARPLSSTMSTRSRASANRPARSPEIVPFIRPGRCTRA
jgi:hypothetical protein